MNSSLHMQVASLQIEDRIRQASTARLAKQASRPAAETRGHGVTSAPQCSLGHFGAPSPIPGARTSPRRRPASSRVLSQPAQRQARW